MTMPVRIYLLDPRRRFRRGSGDVVHPARAQRRGHLHGLPLPWPQRAGAAVDASWLTRRSQTRSGQSSGVVRAVVARCRGKSAMARHSVPSIRYPSWLSIFGPSGWLRGSRGRMRICRRRPTSHAVIFVFDGQAEFAAVRIHIGYHCGGDLRREFPRSRHLLRPNEECRRRHAGAVVTADVLRTTSDHASPLRRASISEQPKAGAQRLARHGRCRRR
jgi:hypothetical protein